MPPRNRTTAYGIKPRIVKITVGVIDVEIEVDVSLGGGGGATTPGECIVPANTGKASVMLRLTTAHVRRKLFTSGCPS
jgi:hypothetical protein